MPANQEQCSQQQHHVLPTSSAHGVSSIPSGLSLPHTTSAQIPTPSQATQNAYELQTAASDAAAGVLRVPSGRGVRKHVCLHPGCGKVFHFKQSAAAHQEKEHRFRRKLGE